MELIERLEARFEQLLARVRQLEEENRTLSAQMAAGDDTRREVQERIEALLVKVQASLDEQ